MPLPVCHWILHHCCHSNYSQVPSASFFQEAVHPFTQQTAWWEVGGIKVTQLDHVESKAEQHTRVSSLTGGVAFYRNDSLGMESVIYLLFFLCLKET